MATSTPWRFSKCAIKATSPNQQGVEGTEWEEVWIWTGKLAILIKSPPYIMGMFLSSLLRRHISTLARYLL